MILYRKEINRIYTALEIARNEMRKSAEIAIKNNMTIPALTNQQEAAQFEELRLFVGHWLRSTEKEIEVIAD